MVPSPKAAFGDWALVAWVSLAVRTDARLWAQGGATVVGLEGVRPPQGPWVSPMSPGRAGPVQQRGLRGPGHVRALRPPPVH